MRSRCFECHSLRFHWHRTPCRQMRRCGILRSKTGLVKSIAGIVKKDDLKLRVNSLIVDSKGLKLNSPPTSLQRFRNLRIDVRRD